MDKQLVFNSKMKIILVKWLIDVGNSNKMTDNNLESLFIAVGIIDRFMSKKHDTVRKDLQLVGIIAMSMAVKYDFYDFSYGDCVYWCDNAYTRKQCASMEFFILEILDYNITFPTSYNFMGILTENDESTEQMKKTASYILVNTLCEHKFVKYKPSIIAYSVIY